MKPNDEIDDEWGLGPITMTMAMAMMMTLLMADVENSVNSITITVRITMVIEGDEEDSNGDVT